MRAAATEILLPYSNESHPSIWFLNCHYRRERQLAQAGAAPQKPSVHSLRARGSGTFHTRTDIDQDQSERRELAVMADRRVS